MPSNATGSAVTRVNTHTTMDQHQPAVTLLDDGGWVVSWTSDSSESGGQLGIYQQRYGASGNAIGSETLINSHTTGGQSESSVTALADGGWLATWTSADQDGSGFGIYQRRFHANGSATGLETLVNTYTTSSQADSSVITLTDGGWVVAWTSSGQDGDNEGIYQQRYQADGSTGGTETRVNTHATDSQFQSSSAALADGGWLVTWSSVGQDGHGYGIYQQRYDGNGAALGPELAVNTQTTADQAQSSVTALADGGWLVTWNSYGDTNWWDIYQQRYDMAGNKVGTETQVNTYTTNFQMQSSVTGLADGGWLVTWRSFGPDSVTFDIYQQRYDTNGNIVGSETLVNPGTAGVQFDPTVKALANGGWIVSWEGQGAGDTYGIYQRSFVPDDTPGDKNETLTGTEADETLIGYDGNDRLGGAGGTDVLVGGFGNDTYIINSGLDDVREFVVQGVDRVLASVSFSLLQHAGLENLILTGKDTINATGNGSDNVLTGNAGKNILKGLGGDDILIGGKGTDKAFGGDGSDRFVFKTGSGKDAIADFDAAGADHDRLDLKAMTSIADFADLKADHVSQKGSSVLINAGHGDTITLAGLNIKDLGSSDFLF
ncbi:hypothetical protein IHQ71_29405 (plasmid) [Rhizobium sp. TH2]|uniref:calcium-binding protein n=1 Tax=Rhizobium sp. TH2 TaxID=2775403 RepID=UPI0021580230|nr:calcium-binding protein [Rhizobium sp. TH2]UVC12161.1 hypothetical protein IHQ71_29405 [Rhizobium sp. TH2]